MRSLLSSLCFLAATLHAKDSPNIVFVLADDLGWAEPACYGNDFNETPHLDRLAEEGMRFTHAYAAAPVCSPYRAALLTGQAPARVGILDYLRPNSAQGLSADQITLPEMLKKNGYQTGIAGKWHLSGYQYHDAEHESPPGDHGFNWTFGQSVKGVGNGANTWPYVFRDQPIRWIDIDEPRLGEEEYLTDRLNLEAVDFIERNRDKPFFLYLSHYAPHSILNGRPDLVEKYRKKHPPGKSTREKCYLCEDAGLGEGDPGAHWAGDHNPHLAAMLESIDEGVGMIVDKLEELGLTENTIVIFTSDNGGETNVTSNAPLRGGKSQLYEGGIRVPLLVKWPGVVEADTVTSAPTMNTDFYPTILDAAGIAVDPEQTLDGVSTLAVWKNADAEIDREFLAWHYPLDFPHFLGGVSSGAIRQGDWKLIEHFASGENELFHLANDPSEKQNVAVGNPDRVAELQGKLNGWREKVDAPMPSPPLLTDIRSLYFGEHFHPGKISERFFYNRDWEAKEGHLRRVSNGTADTRIFLRDAEYKDTVIRFDFRFQDSEDIRLVTGSGGGYNTVLHIRRDHFYLQTAKDAKVPYFSYRHGECAYEFDPDRWYTMTVEFLENEALAHIDGDHVVRATHPIIDRTREYFAFQVDAGKALFDNVQILNASAKKGEEAAAGRRILEAAEGKYPVEKTLEEQHKIAKTNAHERLYQNDDTYRSLVKKVDELDERNAEQFPDAYRSSKEFKKKIQEMRKRLLETDSVFKETLSATHRANRALDEFLFEQKPEVKEWPDHRKKAELERLREKFAGSDAYRRLVEIAEAAQAKLEAAYPQLFVSDDEIAAKRKQATEAVEDDPAFKAARAERAAAYRATQDYIFSTDRELARVSELMEKEP